MTLNAFNQRIVAFTDGVVCANGQPAQVTGYNFDINGNINLIKGTVDLVDGTTGEATTWTAMGINAKLGSDYNLCHYYSAEVVKTAEVTPPVMPSTPPPTAPAQ